VDAAVFSTVGAIVAGFVTGMVALVRIALSAERRRADDWRTAAQTTATANEVMATNIEKLITSVEHLATSQRDTTALLQKLAADRGV
jgi:uncharacterized membrane protein